MEKNVFIVSEYTEMYKIKDSTIITRPIISGYMRAISERVFTDKAAAIQFLKETECRKILETPESVVYSFFDLSECEKSKKYPGKYSLVNFIIEKHIKF